MKKFLILTSAFIALAMTGMAAFDQVGAAWAGSSADQGQEQAFKIEKMTCAACPITVKMAMQRVDGVKSVKVDFDTKTAVVVFDPSLASVGEIAAASTNVGYPATATN